MAKKILVTLGPASLQKDTVEHMCNCGIYVFRINLSHTPVELIEPTIRQIQSWTDVPICLDSEGAQLRNRDMEGGAVTYNDGDIVKIPFELEIGSQQTIPWKQNHRHQVGRKFFNSIICKY